MCKSLTCARTLTHIHTTHTHITHNHTLFCFPSHTHAAPAPPPPPGALEELWKARPEAGLDDLEEGGQAGGPGGKGAELTPVALRYDDAAQYQVGA
jgi:hypothetical protein